MTFLYFVFNSITEKGKVRAGFKRRVPVFQGFGLAWNEWMPFDRVPPKEHFLNYARNRHWLSQLAGQETALTQITWKRKQHHHLLNVKYIIK
jgi:hypothetical protein